jgi:hypothetical protein
MAVVEQMGKPVPDTRVVRHMGKQALLHLLRKIRP